MGETRAGVRRGAIAAQRKGKFVVIRHVCRPSQCSKDLSSMLSEPTDSVAILDVRSPTEFGICHLPSSISERPTRISRCLSDVLHSDVPLPEVLADPERHLRSSGKKLVVVCRLGNDSQIAADALRSASRSGADELQVYDLIGGLRNWHNEVDHTFPMY